MKRTQDLVEVGVVETDDPVGGHKRKCQHWIVKQGEPKNIFLFLINYFVCMNFYKITSEGKKGQELVARL